MADVDKPRVEPRTRMSLAARLRCTQGERAMTVIDLSSRGLLGMMSDPPARGEFVEVRIGGHSLIGHVRWRAGGRFGVVLRERISVSALLGGSAGSAVLAGSRAARRVSGGVLSAIGSDSTLMARAMQAALLLIAVGGASYAMVRYASSSLASVTRAQAAMAGENAADSRNP
ncbi:PilZ domain-containing protein [Novosphingobium colocasiae]|uniref:PilZ domain-containing protein n=1 Tax=Novosphingobium colocasiae TaxID=1256513 RepID=UPI0035B2801D